MELVGPDATPRKTGLFMSRTDELFAGEPIESQRRMAEECHIGE